MLLLRGLVLLLGGLPLAMLEVLGLCSDILLAGEV